MTDCSKIPTLTLVEDAKKAMEDTVLFAGSPENTYTSGLDGSIRDTITGLTVEARNAYRLSSDNPQGNYAVGVFFNESNWTYFYNNEYWGLSDNFDLSTLPYEATQADPNNDPNLQVRSNASQSYVQERVKAAEDRGLGPGASLYQGTATLNGEKYVQNGDAVPAGTTHLTVLINGRPENVGLSSLESGLVADLTETSATIGGASVTFTNALPVKTLYTESDSNSAIENMIAGFPYDAKDGDVVSTGGTIWKIKGSEGTVSLDTALKAAMLNAVLLDDYGLSTDSTFDNSTIFNSIMNLAIWQTGKKVAFRFGPGTYRFANKAIIPWQTYNSSFFGASKEATELFFDYDGTGLEGNIGLHVQCESTGFSNLTFRSSDTSRLNMKLVLHEIIKTGDARYADVDAFYNNVRFGYANEGIVCKGRGLNMSQITFTQTRYAIGLDAPDGEFFEGPNDAQKHETALRRYYFSNIDVDGCNTLFRNIGGTTYSQYLQGVVAVNCGGLALNQIFEGDIANSSFTNMIAYNSVGGLLYNFGNVLNVQINSPICIGDYDPTHAPGAYTTDFDRFINVTGTTRGLTVNGGLVKGSSDRDCMRFAGEVNGLTILGTRFSELKSGDVSLTGYPLMRFSADARRVNVNGVSIDNTFEVEAGQPGVLYELLGGAEIFDSSFTGITCNESIDNYKMLSDMDFGDFTPVIKCGGTPCTLSSAEGEYNRIGNVVTGVIFAVITSFNGTGDITIEGMPYPANTEGVTTKGGVVTVGELTNGTGFTGHVGGRVVGAEIQLTEYATSSMALTTVTDSNFTSPPTVLLTFTYSTR